MYSLEGVVSEQYFCTICKGMKLKIKVNDKKQYDDPYVIELTVANDDLIKTNIRLPTAKIQGIFHYNNLNKPLQ